MCKLFIQCVTSFLMIQLQILISVIYRNVTINHPSQCTFLRFPRKYVNPTHSCCFRSINYREHYSSHIRENLLLEFRTR